MATPGELLHMMESLERENAKRQAQVAVMAEALGAIEEAWGGLPRELVFTDEFHEAIGLIPKALESVPTVLWHGRLGEQGWDRPGFFDAMLGNREVIVLECSVNDASEPKSEQEESDE